MKRLMIVFMAVTGLMPVYGIEKDATVSQITTFREEKAILEMINNKSAACRKTIELLTHSHSVVLKQYDAFANALEKVYIAGEGLIETDVLHIFDAISFAADKHRSQTRKDPNQTPYIIHPIGVANHLITIGHVRDPDIIIAALLHDTVEDTETTFQEIEKSFGERVKGFVEELTDDKSLAKDERKQLQIEHAPKKSAGAAQVKLADKWYNLTDLKKSPPTDWKKERIDAYFSWAQKVVNQLPWVNADLKEAVDTVIKTYWEENKA